MKSLLKIAGTYVILFLIGVLLGGFIESTYDISQWDKGVKAAVITIPMSITFFWFMFIEDV